MPRTVSIFAYGTLQIPEVMLAVTGAEFPAQSARLEGYARYRLAGYSYPGLRIEPGAETGGVLYSRIDVVTLRKLDEFEDDFYRRETLAVTIESGTAVPAEVYVVSPGYYALLSERPWDLEEFRRTGLREFLVRCRS